jgi:hypothetical protein
MVVKVLDIVEACDTNPQGDRVRSAILDQLAKYDIVHLDFSGVTNVTSSFVNSALIELLPKLGIQSVKSRVAIKHVNRQIANMIKDRFTSEEKTAA